MLIHIYVTFDTDRCNTLRDSVQGIFNLNKFSRRRKGSKWETVAISHFELCVICREKEILQCMSFLNPIIANVRFWRKTRVAFNTGDDVRKRPNLFSSWSSSYCPILWLNKLCSIGNERGSLSNTDTDIQWLYNKLFFFLPRILGAIVIFWTLFFSTFVISLQSIWR